MADKTLEDNMNDNIAFRQKGLCFWEEYIATNLPDSFPMGFCRHWEVNGPCKYSGNWETFDFHEEECPYFILEEDNLLEIIE